MKENDETGRKRRKTKKNIYNYNSKTKSVQIFILRYVDPSRPAGKKIYFFDQQPQAGPVPIAPISIPMGPDRLPIRFRNSI